MHSVLQVPHTTSQTCCLSVSKHNYILWWANTSRDAIAVPPFSLSHTHSHRFTYHCLYYLNQAVNWHLLFARTRPSLGNASPSVLPRPRSHQHTHEQQPGSVSQEFLFTQDRSTRIFLDCTPKKLRNNFFIHLGHHEIKEAPEVAKLSHRNWDCSLQLETCCALDTQRGDSNENFRNCTKASAATLSDCTDTAHGAVLSEQRFFPGLSLVQECQRTLQKAHLGAGATVGPELSIRLCGKVPWSFQHPNYSPEARFSHSVRTITA